jgi:glycosyltransferase involved in cell wall biosynthesis
VQRLDGAAARGEPYLLYVYIVYPITSFTLVALKHVQYIRRLGLARVAEMDACAFPSFRPAGRYVAVIHPFYFVWKRAIDTIYGALPDGQEHLLSRALEGLRGRYERVVGIFVCDSDAMSETAVRVLNETDALVVPSRFCVDVYRKSGVIKPTYRVPHGVDPEWYVMPSVWTRAHLGRISPALVELYQYKRRTGRRLLLWWYWHSWWRKGGPWVREVYARLVRKRNDVRLVVKTREPEQPGLEQLMPLGVVQVHGWLTEYEKMALYDLADVTLAFSVGGAFELNALESLARGTPAVAVDWGPWTEYVPPFLRIRPGERVRPLPGNEIHVGYGYAVDVEDAVAKVEDILDSYAEYRARTEEWRQRVLAREYRWDMVARALADVITRAA